MNEEENKVKVTYRRFIVFEIFRSADHFSVKNAEQQKRDISVK